MQTYHPYGLFTQRLHLLGHTHTHIYISLGHLWEQVRVDQGEWVMLHGMLHVHEGLAVHLNCI